MSFVFPEMLSPLELFASFYQTGRVKIVIPHWVGPDFTVARHGDSVGFYAPRYGDMMACTHYELMLVALTPEENTSILQRFTDRGNIPCSSPLDVPETPPVVPTFTRDDTGCYADSVRGQYIGCYIVNMAALYGHDLSIIAIAECSKSANDSANYYKEDYLIEREDYCELWEDAENFLNTLCDDSVYFGSSEAGDWGLWEVETKEDEDTDNE